MCSIGAYEAQLLYWPVQTAPAAIDDYCKNHSTITPTPTASGPNLAYYSGYTLTSPSVYIILSGIDGLALQAEGPCGPSIAKTIISMNPEEVSTARGSGYIPYQMNFADLNHAIVNGSYIPLVPWDAYQGMFWCWMDGEPDGCPVILDNYRPYILNPTGLRDLDPHWSTCELFTGPIFDPPIPLTTAEFLGGPTVTTTSHRPTTTEGASPGNGVTTTGPKTTTAIPDSKPTSGTGSGSSGSGGGSSSSDPGSSGSGDSSGSDPESNDGGSGTGSDGGSGSNGGGSGSGSGTSGGSSGSGGGNSDPGTGNGGSGSSDSGGDGLGAAVGSAAAGAAAGHASGNANSGGSGDGDPAGDSSSGGSGSGQSGGSGGSGGAAAPIPIATIGSSTVFVIPTGSSSSSGGGGSQNNGGSGGSAGSGSDPSNNSGGAVVIGGHTITAGGAATTIDGQTVSVGPNGVEIASAGGPTRTIAFPAAGAGSDTALTTIPPVLHVGTGSFTASITSIFGTELPYYVIDGQTLVPGGTITVRGGSGSLTTIALPSADALSGIAVINGHTTTMSADIIAAAGGHEIITIAGKTYTADSLDEFIITDANGDVETIKPDGKTETINGTPVVLLQGGETAIIGGKTFSLSTVKATKSTASDPAKATDPSGGSSKTSSGAAVPTSVGFTWSLGAGALGLVFHQLWS